MRVGTKEGNQIKELGYVANIGEEGMWTGKGLFSVVQNVNSVPDINSWVDGWGPEGTGGRVRAGSRQRDQEASDWPGESV